MASTEELQAAAHPWVLTPAEVLSAQTNGLDPERIRESVPRIIKDFGIEKGRRILYEFLTHPPHMHQ